jgi:collagenase-like PrtC family protease
MARRKKLVDDVTKQKSEEIIKHAKKKGYDIGEKISLKGSNLKSRIKKRTQLSSGKDLDLLKKLADLQKAGIITKKEFEEKKKKILSKI